MVGEWQLQSCVVWVVALLLVLIHTVLVLRWIGGTHGTSMSIDGWACSLAFPWLGRKRFLAA